MLEGWFSDCAYAPYWMCTTRFMCHICRGTLQNFQLSNTRMSVASCPAQKCPGYARADAAAGYTRRLGVFNCISFGRSNLSMHQNTHSTTTRSGGDTAWRRQYQFQRISGRRYPTPWLLVLQRRKTHLAVPTSARCAQCASGRPSHTFKKVQDFSIALKSGRSGFRCEIGRACQHWYVRAIVFTKSCGFCFFRTLLTFLFVLRTNLCPRARGFKNILYSFPVLRAVP